MKKLRKAKKVLEKQGIRYLIVRIYRYIKWHLIQKPIGFLKKHMIFKKQMKSIVQFLKAILRNIKIFICYYIIKTKKVKLIEMKIDKIISKSKNHKRIMLWRSNFGWNVHLFQRPQHIAKNMANSDVLYFYEASNNDKVKDFKAINESLYLVNLKSPLVKLILEKKIISQNKPCYLHIYSTEMEISVSEMKKYLKKGFKILYEYIDDLSPQISVTSELPKNIKTKYDYVMKDESNCLIVVTADNIEKDVLKYRKKNIVFSCNGVDIDHFQNLKNKNIVTSDFRKVIDVKKPIIGYYGALASWFDYDMLKYAAQNTDFEFVLIGVKYDNKFDESEINKVKNIRYIGPKEYNSLPYYAKEFDVCTIPFLINEITQATSPLKLFEYMALGKPIVTTAMHECKKYKSVLIAENKEDFVEKLNEALKLKNDKKYINLLQKEALENTWESKTKLIIELLDEYEEYKLKK